MKLLSDYSTSLCLCFALFLSQWTHETSAEEVTPHIRTLASSCATCHGTNSLNKSVIPSLIGVDASYFIQKMQSYRNSAKEHDVMTQHAKGLTEQEIEQLAIYFSEQRRFCPVAKKPAINLME